MGTEGGACCLAANESNILSNSSWSGVVFLVGIGCASPMLVTAAAGPVRSTKFSLFGACVRNTIVDSNIASQALQ